MLMFLMILLPSLAVLTMVCIMVAGIRPEEQETNARVAARPEKNLAAEPQQFFAPEAQAPVSRPQVPLEVLLAQIQRHVHLEQAAAKSFLEVPTTESLHSRTESPLVH